MLFSLFAFFAKFWTHNGQTLGMQVWGRAHPESRRLGGQPVAGLLRFVVAIGSWLCFGLGFLWMLWDKDKRTWHDRYSESIVVQLPKSAHKK